MPSMSAGIGRAVEVGRGDLLENRAENAVEIIIALLGDIRRIGILDHNLDHSRLLEQATSLAISSRSLSNTLSIPFRMSAYIPVYRRFHYPSCIMKLHIGRASCRERVCQYV